MITAVFPPCGLRILQAYMRSPQCSLLLICALVVPVAMSAFTQSGDGWTDVRSLIVQSDGSRTLGNTSLDFNDTRDQGSKIVYFDVEKGDNDTAEVYWWDGSQLVDSSGSPTNPDNGLVYGTDPLEPNEAAIQPFAACLTAGDDRLRTQAGTGGPNRWRFSGLAGGYPDAFLFRRGQSHVSFDCLFAGGRSASEPMIVAAYGPLSDGRAIMDPATANPFSSHNWGYAQSWMHQALFSLEIRAHYGYLGTHQADTYAQNGGPTTGYLEDCYFPNRGDGIVTYPPQRTTFRRCIFSHCWKSDAHNQAYFTSGMENRVTFDEVIMYKNGYKVDPLRNVDPRRDIFSRNIYQGGGARMGHVYRNLISMDGASGGPQMRLGGVIENSLIVEGYWYSSTSSNENLNEWALADPAQQGSTALVRNNVQFVFKSGTPVDPDLNSDNRAQPGWGYSLSGFSYGALVEGNIVSGAMLADELGSQAKTGLQINFGPTTYANGHTYTQKRNVVRNNIAYRIDNGITVAGNAAGVEDIVVEDNAVVSNTPVDAPVTNLIDGSEVSVDRNRFYSSGTLPSAPWFGSSNTLSPTSNAAVSEGWPDPDRTVRRYVTEVLGLTILDWSDDPFLDPVQVQLRVDAGEPYDPAGMRTFMAVATHMRRGGAAAIPDSGKPSFDADYPWDERYTAIAVVNWVRAGFGLDPVAPDPVGDVVESFESITHALDGYDGMFRVFVDQAYPEFEYVIQDSRDLELWSDRARSTPGSAGFLSLEAPLLPLDSEETSSFYRAIVRPKK